jgi:hypothetical protein
MQRTYELKSLEEIPALQEDKFVLWIDLTEPTKLYRRAKRKNSKEKAVDTKGKGRFFALQDFGCY